MKLILITLVALVGVLMVACSSEPAAPTATPPPAFSDDEVLGAVRGHLSMQSRCSPAELHPHVFVPNQGR